MPGYAYPVGATEADTGNSKGVSVLVTDSGANKTTVFTASQKTQVNSILLSNNYGSILPVNLYIYRDDTEDTTLLSNTRVLKNKYSLQRLVSGDTRGVDTSDPQLDRNKILTELTLNIGDSLKANCPIEDAVTVTVNVTEGVK